MNADPLDITLPSAPDFPPSPDGGPAAPVDAPVDDLASVLLAEVAAYDADQTREFHISQRVKIRAKRITRAERDSIPVESPATLIALCSLEVLVLVGETWQPAPDGWLGVGRRIGMTGATQTQIVEAIAGGWLAADSIADDIGEWLMRRMQGLEEHLGKSPGTTPTSGTQSTPSA